MVAKKWRVTISSSANASLVQHVDVQSTNWIAALRAARTQLGEEGAVPQGANCAVRDDGTVTVHEPGTERNFTIAVVGDALAPKASATQAKPSKPKHLARTMAYNPNPSPMVVPHQSKVPTTTGSAGRVVANAGPASAPQAAPSSDAARAAVPAPQARTPRRRSATMAFEVGQHGHLIPNPAVMSHATAEVSKAKEPAPQIETSPPLVLEELLTRDEDPSPDNPLTYRERAYFMENGTAVEEVEQALLEKLDEIKATIASAKRGKYVHISAFDYRWSRLPSRPPLVVLEWRDWRGDPQFEYPGRTRVSSPQNAAVPVGATDDIAPLLKRLDEADTLLSALKLGLKLMTDAIPCEAASACLYDVSTHELRFVVVQGGDERRQGTAVPASKGLLGRSLESDSAWLHVRPIQLVTYDATVDGCGIEKVHSLLLRPLRHDGMPLGVIQLVNRSSNDREFTHEDGQVADQIGDHLATALHELKRRMPR